MIQDYTLDNSTYKKLNKVLYKTSKNKWYDNINSTDLLLEKLSQVDNTYDEDGWGDEYD